jgi:preprotein translocase subunit SecA
MFQSILTKIFGSKNERDLKRLIPIVNRINELEPAIKKLSDEDLRRKTVEFKERHSRGESLEALTPEAFAAVREAAVRTIGQRHFDVQLMGGMVLHQGKIAEMKTGEGKTLTSTLAVYLNALEGKGIHIATVNDYLAKRDADWMGAIYKFLGLSVGVTVHGLSHPQKKEAYNCDITYGVHSEFGFDYLWDNMATSPEGRVQRGHHYAIVDEVDSILIDEARTPLIISSGRGDLTETYLKVDRVIPRLKKDTHYDIEYKSSKRGTVALTEAGVAEVERLLGVNNLYDPENFDLVHHVNQALVAHTLYKRDVDYVVQEGQVIIVDEFTGRLQPGRRYSEGLHQAIEAKERVKIVEESQTVARITYQNYFRMYKKLAGMTGTAETEDAEFHQIYNLDVVVIPTNEPMIQIDCPDVVYKTERAKFKAVVEEIVQLHKEGQPVLVGTISIEKSETLSEMLKPKGIKHRVLNAKEHAKEAEIIKHAGQPNAVTIATNMAGRGVDIILGEGITEKGGLHIVGTERHEARRIDNQLRGRSGRQGDPGSSRFYLSLEDDLMRKFGSERLANFMDKVGMQEDIPIEHPWVTRAIEKAQKRVEEQHFSIRKQILKYDDVMNTQRETIYEQRNAVLEGKNLKEEILDMIEDVVTNQLEVYTPKGVDSDEWDIEALIDWVRKTYTFDISQVKADLKKLSYDELKDLLLKFFQEAYNKRESEIGEEKMRQLERLVMLDRIDSHWMDHLYEIDYLEEGIGLRAYGQKDPLIEFKNEAFNMFSSMIEHIKEEVTEYMFKIQLVTQPSTPQPAKAPLSSRSRRAISRQNATESFGREQDSETPSTPVRVQKIGRNELCPCGSGKKYKRCCGR